MFNLATIRAVLLLAAGLAALAVAIVPPLEPDILAVALTLLGIGARATPEDRYDKFVPSANGAESLPSRQPE